MSKFDWVFSLPRRVGHTTAACGLYQGSPTVVMPTIQQAQQATKDHGVRGVALEQSGALQGFAGPVVFDVESVKCIVAYYEGQLQEVREALQNMRDALGYR